MSGYLLCKWVLLVTLLILLAACESRTDYGKCVGLGEKQNPKLEYKLSGRNIAVGVIFLELIAPPIIVATDETFCPIGPTSTPIGNPQ